MRSVRILPRKLATSGPSSVDVEDRRGLARRRRRRDLHERHLRATATDLHHRRGPHGHRQGLTRCSSSRRGRPAPLQFVATTEPERVINFDPLHVPTPFPPRPAGHCSPYRRPCREHISVRRASLTQSCVQAAAPVDTLSVLNRKLMAGASTARSATRRQWRCSGTRIPRHQAVPSTLLQVVTVPRRFPCRRHMVEAGHVAPLR